MKYIIILALSLSGLVVADELRLEKKINKSIANTERSSADQKRDSSRKPSATLAFFGIKPQMKVLELIPGGGWYTTILQNYIKKGNLEVALYTSRVEKLAKQQKWQINIVDTKTTRIGKGYPVIYDQVVLPENSFDAVLTFRNYHNFDAETRKKVNKAVFTTLKPGGIYAVVGHTGRHMAPKNKETWRRIDPVLAIKELLDIGFIFADYSDLHYRPDDGLTTDTTHKSVDRDSDRFTLKFVKP